MKKSTMLFLLVTLLIIICPTISMACDVISLQVGSRDAIVDGKTVNLDAVPYIKNGRTMVPIRFISEAFGAELNYKDVSGEPTLSVLYENHYIFIFVNSLEATYWEEKNSKHGQTIKLDVPAEIRNDRIYVPLRLISETFGFQIQWDSQSQTVIIVRD